CGTDRSRNGTWLRDVRTGTGRDQAGICPSQAGTQRLRCGDTRDDCNRLRSPSDSAHEEKGTARQGQVAGGSGSDYPRHHRLKALVGDVMTEQNADVAIIMGSQSDWPTMRHAAETLDLLDVPYEARIISAHRTPERLYEFARGARDEGFRVIIAGAGGAAHLPGMTAALTPLPVFGVPIESKAL